MCFDVTTTFSSMESVHLLDLQVKGRERQAIDLDDAIADTGCGKFHCVLLLTSGLCLMTVTIETLNTGYLLPAAQCDLKLSTQDKGTLNAMVFAGIIMSAHFWGFLADTKGRKKVLIYTLIINSMCTIIASFSHTLWIYLIMRFLNGVFICGPSAVIYAYLGEFNSNIAKPKAIIWACTFVSFGKMTLPGLAWLIIPQQWSITLPWITYNSWRIFLLLCTIPGIVTAILLITCLPESPKFLLSQGDEAAALNVLRQMFVINTGQSSEKYLVFGLKEGERRENTLPRKQTGLLILADVWKQTWHLFHAPHLFNMILACILQFGLFSSSNGIILLMPDLFKRLSEYTYLYPKHELTVCEIAESGYAAVNKTQISDGYATECKTVIDMGVYQNTFIIGAACTVSYLLNGYFVGCMGRRNLLVMNLLISGCSGIALYFVKTAYELLALSCLFLALSSTCISLVGTAVVELFPTHLRAMAVSISLMMGRLGAAFTSLILGIIIERSCGSVFFGVGGLVAYLEVKGSERTATDLDDAIEKTGYGKFHYLLLLMSGLCLMSVTIELQNTAYILPAAECDLELSTQDKGILNAMVFAGMTVSSHFWGFLADTKGRRKVLIYTLTINGICTIISSFSHSLWVYLIIRFLNGVFICAPPSVTFTCLGEFNSCKTRSKAIVWAWIFVSLGVIIMPGLAWLIIPRQWSITLPWITYNSWRIFLVVGTVPGIVTAILFIKYLPESPKFLLSQGDETAALKVLRHMFIINTGKPPGKYLVFHLKMENEIKGQLSPQQKHGSTILTNMWNQTWPLFLPPYLFNMILACILQFVIYGSANGIILLMPDIFNRLSAYAQIFPEHGLTVCQVAESGFAPVNETQVSNSYATECKTYIDMEVYQNTLFIGVSCLLAYLLNSYFVGCMERRKLLSMNLLISGCSGIALNFVKTSNEFISLFCLHIALSSTCISLTSIAVVELFPTHLRAMAMCISFMMGRIGTVLTNLMVGLLLEINCGSVFFTVGGLVAFCGFLVFLLPSSKKHVVRGNT